MARLKYSLKTHLILLNWFILIFFSTAIYSQTTNLNTYQYISPKPGSGFNRPQSNIIIRYGEKLKPKSIDQSHSIEVTGIKSGEHDGELILLEDFKTILFNPYAPFAYGEEVKVIFGKDLVTESSIPLPIINFSFKTALISVDEDVVFNFSEPFGTNSYIEKSGTKNNYIPSFNSSNEILISPDIYVDVSNNPTPGFLFIAPFSINNVLNYLMILDNNGIPIYYSEAPIFPFDFKLQPDGYLTFYNSERGKFFQMDSSYAIVDSFRCQNGFPTDIHDLIVLPNGHSYLMSYDPQQVRMDTVVAGGDSTAIVLGIAIQELDENRNVIFQWRGWDHYKITDATEDIDLTAHIVDYVHSNSIEIDYDGNIILSSRHFDEITKINKQTGDIIWRFGGLKSKNNQFLIIGDPITFSHQHDVRRLPNGNLTLFDNGNLHIPQVSRSLEYQLDEINKNAILVWRYNEVPEDYYYAMGSSRRLSNHNTLINWGLSLVYDKILSEVRVDGSKTFQISMADTITNYRAFRNDWRTTLFTAEPDSVFFESIPVGDSALINISLINNSTEPLDITGYFLKNDFYSVMESVPFIIPASGSSGITIKFKPEEDGYFKDTLHIRNDTPGKRVAQIMILAGRTDSIYSDVNQETILKDYKLDQNYPNPFNPFTTIKFSIPERSFVSIKIFDLLGREVDQLINTEMDRGEYSVEFNAGTLPSGIYLYRISAGEFIKTKKMMILK